MFGTDGQKVKTIDEAEGFIRQFLIYEHSHGRQLDASKNHDFDLYLPWMMEIVINAPEEEGSQEPTLLDSLYMDAAWSLVTKGYLRPGPRRVSGENPHDGYGKGYTLTEKGKTWQSEP